MARSRTAQLETIVRRLDRRIAEGTKASSTLTRWRLAVFLIGAVSTVALYKAGWYHGGNLALTAFVGVFIGIAAYHNRVESRIHRLRLWKHIKLVHRARMALDWAAIPPRPGEGPAAHPYAADLDLFGAHSLTRLIDTTVSDRGRERLHAWLLTQPPAPAQWQSRQNLVKELAPRPLFRDRLALEARLTGEQEINGRRLAAVLEHPIGWPSLTTVLIIQSLLALTTISLALAALLDWLPGYWMFSFAAYALIYFMTDQGEELLEHAVGLHHETERLGTVLNHLERQATRRGSCLASACAALMGGASPSRHLKRAARTLSAISIKAHPLVHLAVNALVPWDLWFTKRLQQVQQEIRHQLPRWLDCLAEVEAASALATFAYLHPAYVWPAPLSAASEHNGTTAALRAARLGHPLIPEQSRVTNDYALNGAGAITLVTGSNMSGKSTFLRTVGVNVCLAQAGAPVCADRLEWTWSRLACCIRIDDSLDAGLSFFYAEVKRLKTILDATRERQTPPVLFLIDEIFKGTNNRERLIGSRAYIAELSKGNGFGLVSTHDLELADLEKVVPGLTNAHFQETVSAGALQFDYKLRSGPCPTTNALRIMELEGLPVQENSRD
ncbi:MutS family DNA mismatch repair protein [Nitrospira moscoviensis]|uniref:Putative DNA mismatch repair protein, MutS family n=1 Tax=Nitrospira moscoviensis TaxID=42253 RepID=A0A0K2G9H6_NITMO|nr:MutS family DNA mismatch repair protein [Nitrospira moscoviensis]ALA57509.1 putative DNA mismatch repair protein, MutS family [Nitrospira moscoviensis]